MIISSQKVDLSTFFHWDLPRSSWQTSAITATFLFGFNASLPLSRLRFQFITSLFHAQSNKVKSLWSYNWLNFAETPFFSRTVPDRFCLFITSKLCWKPVYILFSKCLPGDYSPTEHALAFFQCQLRSEASICQEISSDKIAANGREMHHKTSLWVKMHFSYLSYFPFLPCPQTFEKKKRLISSHLSIKTWVWVVSAKSLQKTKTKTFQRMMQIELKKSAEFSCRVSVDKTKRTKKQKQNPGTWKSTQAIKSRRMHGNMHGTSFCLWTRDGDSSLSPGAVAQWTELILDTCSRMCSHARMWTHVLTHANKSAKYFESANDIFPQARVVVVWHKSVTTSPNTVPKWRFWCLLGFWGVWSTEKGTDWVRVVGLIFRLGTFLRLSSAAQKHACEVNWKLQLKKNTLPSFKDSWETLQLTLSSRISSYREYNINKYNFYISRLLMNLY